MNFKINSIISTLKMRIIGRVCSSSSNPRAFQIEIEEDKDVNILKEIFFHRIGIPV